MQALAIKPDGCYLDGTFGRGGHARAILSRLGPAGRLLGLDRDPEAVAVGRALALEDGRFSMHRVPFSSMGRIAKEEGVAGRLDGILLDVGVSSPQLDRPERGFSFSADGPLDMRMDPDSGQSAAEWLAEADEVEIVRVLREYGEERFARRIARAICAAREEAPIRTTGALAAICERAVPTREPGKHPATRSFQALRIQVNAELDELQAALGQVCELLATGGRLVVISFHSLEDRLVKRFIRDQARGPDLPRGLPIQDSQIARTLKVVGKAQRAGEAELARNPRARSAVLRAAERL